MEQMEITVNRHAAQLSAAQLKIAAQALAAWKEKRIRHAPKNLTPDRTDDPV